jgi:hypothetical protein
MKHGFLSIRLPYGKADDGVLKVEVQCRSEEFTAIAEGCVGDQGLTVLAAQLQGFPKTSKDSVTFEAGVPGEISLEFRTVGSLGQIGVVAKLAAGTQPSNSASLWLPLEASQIDRFCRQLLKLSDTQSGEARIPS